MLGKSDKLLEAAGRREQLKLTEEEVAFYDALEVNDSAVKVLGDETLRTIARELVATVRQKTTIDWTVRENVRAHLRVLVKRILRKYGYPPDKQEKATLTVLEQAERLIGSLGRSVSHNSEFPNTIFPAQGLTFRNTPSSALIKCIGLIGLRALPHCSKIPKFALSESSLSRV